MARPSLRITLVYAVTLGATTLGAAYGCGGDGGGGGASGNDGDSATSVGEDATLEASVQKSDARALSDGATPADAEAGASTDATSDADASSDGSADAGDASNAAADAEAGPPPGPLSADYIDYDINHVLETGQSNSVGRGGRPDQTLPLNTVGYTLAQPFTNLMFDTGVMTSKDCDEEGCTLAGYVAPTSFVPLIENDGYFPAPEPNVETPSSSMANGISNAALTQFMFNARAGYPTKHDVLVSDHGRSGNTYWCLRKGGCNYKVGYTNAFDEGKKQVTAAKALADALGKTYVVRAVTTVHGESDNNSYRDNNDTNPEFPLDGTNGVPNRIKEYDDALIEWQEDYEAMAKAITGQVQPVPLFVSGLTGWTGARHSKLSLLQVNAHLRAPGKVVYVAPGYIFEGAVEPNYPGPNSLECVHLDMRGERHLGEYFAKAYAQVIFKGKPWEPLRPTDVQRVGAVITVKFLVPSPPLVLDTARVAMIGNYGFDFSEGGVLQPIASVVVTAPDTVTLTLAAAPGAGVKRLTYAMNELVPGGCIGPGILSTGGARGNLRDSDPTPSRLGFTLYNWEVPFDMPVP
jgi:hypothetical protein